MERWGDYSAAVPDASNGSIWVASEWIPGTFGFAQGLIVNWGTRIDDVTP